MSKKSVRPATRLQPSRRQAADCINQTLQKSDITEICHTVGAAPDCTISLTLRRNLGLRGRAFIVRLPVIQKHQTSRRS